jgi:hypothetical protein
MLTGGVAVSEWDMQQRLVLQELQKYNPASEGL